MPFQVALIAHAPDADPEKHRSVIETAKYKLTTLVVSSQAQALEAARQLVREGVHSIMLCPGFTHQNIAEIAAAAGPQVGVTVARGDGPSSRVTGEVMKREGWFAPTI